MAISLIHHITVQTAKDLGAKYQATAADRLIAEMVERQNRPGRRAGKGFYDYPSDGPKRLWPGLSQLAPEAATQPSVEEVKTRYLAIQALEAARCLEENVVTDPADADVGALLGWGFAPWTGGPLSYIDMLGTGPFEGLLRPAGPAARRTVSPQLDAARSRPPRQRDLHRPASGSMSQAVD